VRNERGQVVAWCGINLDISHLKAAEAQLRESDRRKDEFLAMLAHELRNPLASIGNALQVQMLAEADDQAVARAREIAGRQLHQLTRLVDDLLDVSRIVVGKITLRPERVDLAQVVDRAVETSRPLVEQRGHALTIALPAEPAWLDADILRLSQAFSNLLNNAAKFTEPGGRVSLRAEEEGDWIVVRVRDSGIGIPAETLPRVFEMFAQGRRARDVEEGLGLGLSLVRRLVEKHGGTVAATSEGPGRGSTFTVRLPRASPPEIQRAPLPRPLRSSRAPGRRALVVDDNADSAESLAMLLTLQGHDVRVAHGGEEALAVFRDHRPEVVLLDIGLPDIDGHEVARRIREGGGAAGVLLVALTGWGQSEDRQRSKEAGFDRHLTKPVEPAVLQSLFEESPRSPDRT
jgi:CheY-like chemotaxis protein/nitrogen-specific signal transduction histidine kinase